MHPGAPAVDRLAGYSYPYDARHDGTQGMHHSQQSLFAGAVPAEYQTQADWQPGWGGHTWMRPSLMTSAASAPNLRVGACHPRSRPRP
jgi:hypothetical protein